MFGWLFGFWVFSMIFGQRSSSGNVSTIGGGCDCDDDDNLWSCFDNDNNSFCDFDDGDD